MNKVFVIAVVILSIPFNIFADMTAATLATNEFAFRHPSTPEAQLSLDWEMTSGSLFSLPNGLFWTGVPDGNGVDAQSRQGTNSAVFRMVSTDRNYRNTAVSLDFKISQFVTTPKTPSQAWDGIHIMLRYQSQYELYYASVARRDGQIVIKKKCPGGISNGGTYYDLSPTVYHEIPVGTEASFTAAVDNTGENAVRIILLDEEGHLLLSAEDHGVGCPAITQPGSIGVRGDNAEFTFSLNTIALP